MQSPSLFRRSLAALASLSFLGLSGCASLLLGPGDSPSRYTLEPLDVSTTTGEPLPVSMVITDPLSEAAFDTSRISYSPEALRYEYYTDAEWTDQLPLLFGLFLQRSFENDGRLQTVGDRRAVPLGDYVLRTDIRAFHIEDQGGQRLARVSYSSKLFDSRNRTLATEIFSVTEPVAQSNLAASVRALNTASKEAGRQTLDWVVEHIRQNPPARERSSRDAS